MATSSELRASFVAVDGGPREALAPVAAAWPSQLADSHTPAAESEATWSEHIAALRPHLMVVGTSDSGRGRRIELCARRAAASARLPIACIEDFPGNYTDVPGGEASLLLVESEIAREMTLSRLGTRAPRIEVAPSPRYDRYREQLLESRQATRNRWARESIARVLWAGQPETADCILTLRSLLPLLRGHELMFKAHPRDTGAASGAYDALLREVRWSEWTHATVRETLDAAPRLVLTQFSSLAIEAGFVGIPSLFILLPDAGGARLREKKGYGVPPACSAGGAAWVADTGAIPFALDKALSDERSRAQSMNAFDAYFHVHTRAAKYVVEKLWSLARDWK